MKCLRSDNGRDYTSKEFQGFYEKCGIKRHFLVKRIPQQNGMAERINRILMEKVRCMMLHAGLPKVFWVDSVDATYYLMNRSPHIKLDRGISEKK